MQEHAGLPAVAPAGRGEMSDWRRESGHLLIRPEALNGKRVAVIADEMALSKKSIFKIRASAKKKLGISSNMEILKYAIKNGFVE